VAHIDLDKTLAAPPGDVFELLSDHAGYVRFRGITKAKLVREGTEERNGVGALRALAVGPIRFEEEITAFDRPLRMDYVIRKVNAPLEHEGGSIELSPAGSGTRVLWRSTFTFRTPIVGGLLGAIFAAIFKRGFTSMLNDVERLVRECDAAAGPR
jgi:Polyketide cyclase / dehydrase and lipid transport